MCVIGSGTLVSNTPEDWLDSDHKDDKAGDQHRREGNLGPNEIQDGNVYGMEAGKTMAKLPESVGMGSGKLLQSWK